MPGGEVMDTFMDKLAQKLTAQEIIRGNLAADAEEMDTLKEQMIRIPAISFTCLIILSIVDS